MSSIHMGRESPNLFGKCVCGHDANMHDIGGATNHLRCNSRRCNCENFMKLQEKKS
jgi:hypothetical protein